jgi:hypothetical protein
VFGRIEIMEYHILKNIPDLHKKGKNVYISNAISQKDSSQPGTNVALPDDKNVVDAREFIQDNKK